MGRFWLYMNRMIVHTDPITTKMVWVNGPYLCTHGLEGHVQAANAMGRILEDQLGLTHMRHTAMA